MSDAITNLLKDLDLTPEIVSGLDYLFIPYFASTHSHHFLMGLAPKQRFVFIIDSCMNT